jgi:hypothetical protein
VEYQNDAQQLLDEIEEVWGVFLRVQIFIFFVLAILFILVDFGDYFISYRLVPFLDWIGVMLILVYALVQVDNLWLRPQMWAPVYVCTAIVFVTVEALALSGCSGAIIVI